MGSQERPAICTHVERGAGGIEMWASVFKEETQTYHEVGRGPMTMCLPGGDGHHPVCPPQVFTRMGKCYTFNSGADGAELLTTTRGGMGNGLDIMLDVQQEEYLPVWRDNGREHTDEAGGGHGWGAKG